MKLDRQRVDTGMMMVMVLMVFIFFFILVFEASGYQYTLIERDCTDVIPGISKLVGHKNFLLGARGITTFLN